MVAISPFSSMSAPSSSREELKASSSTLRTAPFRRPPPSKFADSSFTAVSPAGSSSIFTTGTAGPAAPANFTTGNAGPFDRTAVVGSLQVATAAGKYARETTSVAGKTKTADTSQSFHRSPPPLLLSNFFAPLLNQFPRLTGTNCRPAEAQRKQPIEKPPTADKFPPLPKKALNVNHPSPVTGTSSAPAQDPEYNGEHPSKQPSKKQQVPLLDKLSHPPSYREAVSATWAQEVDVSFAPSSLSALTIHNGEPALVISEEDESRFAENFRFALIGKFIQGRPTMADIRKDLQVAGFVGECHVGLIDQRHVIFQFEFEVDFQRLWLKKVWTIRGFHAKLFRWSTKFCPQKEPSVAPVWINFPLLPVHLCNKDTLFSLGSAVGKPLKLDLATAAVTKVLRPSEARICIELDVLKPLPDRVWIETKHKGMWQQIIYEDLPEYCTTCEKMGHSETNCKLKQTRKVWVRKEKIHGKNLEGSNGPIVHPQPALYEEEKLSCPQDKVQEGDQFAEMQKCSTIDLENVSIAEAKDQQEVSLIDLEKANIVDLTLAIVPRTTSNWADDYLDHFTSKLGQLLEFMNRKESAYIDVEQTIFDNTNNQPMDLPEQMMNLETNSKAPLEINHATPMENWEEGTTALEFNSSLHRETPNEPKHWKEGEPAGVHKVFHNQAMETDDREDCWTETSFEEDEIDKLDEFVDRMERRFKSPKPFMSYAERKGSNLLLTDQGIVLKPLGAAERAAELNAAWKNLLASSHTALGTNSMVASMKNTGMIDKDSGIKVKGIDAWTPAVRAKLEDEKKRKYGMSDRVTRSMYRASNTDPSRPFSL